MREQLGWTGKPVRVTGEETGRRITACLQSESYNYHKTCMEFAPVFLSKKMTLNFQGDTSLQLMTVCSVFAIAGLVGSRLWRLLQKRRLRRPFHIWIVF